MSRERERIDSRRVWYDEVEVGPERPERKVMLGFSRGGS